MENESHAYSNTGSRFKKVPSKAQNFINQQNKRELKQSSKQQENEREIDNKENVFVCLSKNKESKDKDELAKKETDKSQNNDEVDTDRAFAFIYEKKSNSDFKKKKLRRLAESQLSQVIVKNDSKNDNPSEVKMSSTQPEVLTESRRHSKREDILERFKCDLENHVDLSKNSKLSVLTHANSSDISAALYGEDISDWDDDTEDDKNDTDANLNSSNNINKQKGINSSSYHSDSCNELEDIDKNLKHEEKEDQNNLLQWKNDRYIFPHNLLDDDPKNSNGEGIEGETYHVESFLSRKIYNKKPYYKVKWRGLDESEATWVKNKYLRPYSLACSAYANYSYKSSANEEDEHLTSENPQIQMKLAVAQDSSKILIEKIRTSEGFEEYFYQKARFLFQGLNRISKIGRFEFGDKARKIIWVIKSETNQNELMMKVDWHLRCNGFKPYSSIYSWNIVKKYNMNVILDFYESKLKFI